MEERLEPARTCLLLFDLLEGHVNRDEASRARFRPVIANAAALLVAARSVGAMIAYACADHRADGAGGSRVIRDTDNRLRPIRPGDPEADKPAVVGGTREARIGTSILRDLIREGRQAGKPVRLRIIAVNPVKRLYEREGFRVTSTTPERIHMELQP